MGFGRSMGRNRKKKKKKTLQQIKDYLNDQSIRIKQISRGVFMDADTKTRVHKDKKKYSRKQKHKKRLDKDG